MGGETKTEKQDRDRQIRQELQGEKKEGRKEGRFRDFNMNIQVKANSKFASLQWSLSNNISLYLCNTNKARTSIHISVLLAEDYFQ